MDNTVFPPEIFGLIIEELGQLSYSSLGRAALCNLSRCARAFYEPCRLHLWRTLYLHNKASGPFYRHQKRLESLSEALGRTDGPAPLVKGIKLMFVRPDDNRDAEDQDADLSTADYNSDSNSMDEEHGMENEILDGLFDRWTKALFVLFPKIVPYLSHLESLELEGGYEDAMFSEVCLHGGLEGIQALLGLMDNSPLKSPIVTRLSIPFLLLQRLPTCLERLMLDDSTYSLGEIDNIVAANETLTKISPKHLQLEVSPEFSNLLSQQPRSLFEGLSTLKVNILNEEMLNNVHERILPNAINTLEVLGLKYPQLNDYSSKTYSQRLESLFIRIKSATRLKTLQLQLFSDHPYDLSPSCNSDSSRLVKAYLDSPLFRGITRLELDVVWGCGNYPVANCFVDRSESEIDMLDTILANDLAFPRLQQLKVNFRVRGRWFFVRSDDIWVRERAKEEQRRIAREAGEAFSETLARGVEVIF
ncbi:hypothetical protein BKA70DRAFT_1563026 [Coprinopsis sp. MPI-PUGE-AT-0042]|nr:hypothetical protein BKA70DRAFT_1563026 [Coprinopsis sp. MPI-PUGE-AT-0042]